MAYLDIENLYKNQTILLFKECYAMEKIHGTSAHITYKEGQLTFFSGGGKYETFVALFDQDKLKTQFDDMALGDKSVIIYGEFYGGKLQGMSNTYGPNQKFVAFDVNINDVWLNVPKAEQITKSMGLEFVHYTIIPTTLEAIDFERGTDSIQAIRNGTGTHMREGIVLRPIEEMTTNNGERVIAKHKRDEFKETKTTRKIDDPTKLAVLSEAKLIADEWVTYERLNHILTKGMIESKIENTGTIIKLMIDDIIREANTEIIDSPESRKEIGKLTAIMFKNYLKKKYLE